MDRTEMRRRVDAARVARLATVDAGGHPHLVPICFALVGDTLYNAVDHKPKHGVRLRRFDNVRASGHVCVLVDEYDDDWSRLWWVRLDGYGRVVEDAGEATSALSALAARYPQYAGRAPHEPVLAVTVTRWTGWTATPTRGTHLC
jgi:PPOX class probable F420-dependent enzyme